MPADQIIEITQNGINLSKSHGFLQIKLKDEFLGQAAIDDIVALIISTPGCTLSTVLIDRLCNENIPIVICGKNYLPSSIILPVEGQGRQFHTMQGQIHFSQPKRKRAWQTVIRAKINNQSAVLSFAGKDTAGFSAISYKVKSGDPENCEAQAARLYWRRLFGEEFKRDRQAFGINSALNYTYTILRGCIARAVVSAGLHPSFSLHHKNPQNAFNLVDDLMEPFRPIADCLVWRHAKTFTEELTAETKPLLSAIVNLTVPMSGESSPLSLAAVRYCRAFAAYYTSENANLIMPSLPLPLELESVENI